MSLAGAWIVAVAIVWALVLAGVGGLQLLREQKRLESRIAVFSETQLRRFDPQRFGAVAARFDRAAEEAEALAVRGRAAVTALAAAIRALRVPEAVEAIRLTAIAVRALRAIF